MKPTSVVFLVGLVVLGGLLGYLIGTSLYADLPPLPTYPPVVLGVVAVLELALGKAIRDRLQGRARRGARPLHPEQIARAAVLAKASSPTGALLAGLYAGLAVYLVSDSATAAVDDRRIAVVCAITALLLVGAALFLERTCRLPEEPEGSERLD